MPTMTSFDGSLAEAKAVRHNTRTDEISQELLNLNDRLLTIRDVLHENSRRTFGPLPETAEKAPAEPEAQGSIERIEMQIRNLHSIVYSLDELASTFNLL